MSFSRLSDYSTYLPQSQTVDPWEIGLVSAGRTNARRNSTYPPSLNSHPVDHALSWNAGRVLHNHVILLVSEGSGQFESSESPLASFEQWNVLLLFPGVWHRYRPDPCTGWVEDWIELRGKSVDRLQETGVISPKRPILSIGSQPDIVDAIHEVHRIAQSLPIGYQSLLGTLSMHVLARVLSAADSLSVSDIETDTKVRLAQHMFTNKPLEVSELEKVAGKMEFGGSKFRRAFKARTGLSPKQYQLDVRLRRAQQLLVETKLPISEISSMLGYDTAFHLSADFKSRTGMTPTQWRSRDGLPNNPPTST